MEIVLACELARVRCWENKVSATDVLDQREFIRCIGKEILRLVRVDRPRAVAAQRSVTNSVQSGTIKHGVEGDEGGW